MTVIGSSIIRIALALLLIAGGSTAAAAWGWWDRCYGYHCYGPPYGNYAPPPGYVYDPQKAPTWTGNGWAHLPAGTYHPAPVYAPDPPPPHRVRPGGLLPRWLAPAW